MTSVPARGMPRYLKATYLANDEYLLEETRATKLFYFPGPVAWTVVWAAIAVVLLAPKFLHFSLVPLPTFLSAQIWRYLGYAAGLLAVAGLLGILVRYLRWISTVYAVTSRRVILQKGILGRTFDEIPILQVRGVDVHQTFGERLLRYGSVRVSSEGGQTLGNEDWRGIPHPFKFQRIIENATIAAGPGTSAPAGGGPAPSR